MQRYSRMLVILDPAASEQPALGKALRLAKLLHADVELLVCETHASREARISSHAFPSPDAVDLELRQWIESQAVPLRYAGIEVSIAITRGESLLTTTLEWLRNSPAHLVVKDTHHHSAIRRTFLTSIDRHLIRECPQPLLLTKATRWVSPPCVGAAIDPTHPRDSNARQDRAIMSAAANLAFTFKSRPQVFHAYYPAVLEQTMDALTRLLHDFDVPAECRHVSMGVPSEFLTRMTRQAQIDVMVMGALSRSRRQLPLIGNTAERLLEYLPCDILTVKPASAA